MDVDRDPWNDVHNNPHKWESSLLYTILLHVFRKPVGY